MLRGLEAGCAAPVGVSAVARDGRLDVVASVYRIDGTESIVRTAGAAYDPADPATLLSAAQSLSAQLVAELLDGGAADLAPLGVTRMTAAKPLVGWRVLVPRGGPWGHEVAPTCAPTARPRWSLR